jgi:hypothetical protein
MKLIIQEVAAMKVRDLKLFGLVIALAAVISQSVRAEESRPSQRTLSEMGLGGLVVMSDDEALGIRGFGFKGGHGGSSAVAFGNSFATINTPFGTAHSENGYAAEGKKFAFGANHSEAGVELKVSSGHKGKGGKMRNGDSNRWGGKTGTKWGGHNGNGGMNGHSGGGKHGAKKSITISFKLFAGGWSVAKAH